MPGRWWPDRSVEPYRRWTAPCGCARSVRRAGPNTPTSESMLHKAVSAIFLRLPLTLLPRSFSSLSDLQFASCAQAGVADACAIKPEPSQAAECCDSFHSSIADRRLPSSCSCQSVSFGASSPRSVRPVLLRPSAERGMSARCSIASSPRFCNCPARDVELHPLSSAGWLLIGV